MNQHKIYQPVLPSVTFLGAARSVSGSMHLVKSGPFKFLLDCGLNRGPREETRRRNSFFDFDPSTIDAIFLSHAHMDHCGNIPNLVRQGFSGPIYCTHATRDLVSVMLTDSVRIQTNESQFAHSGRSRGFESRPIDHEDVRKTIESCIGVDFDVDETVNSDVTIRFIEAGHILGSASILVKMMHGWHEYSINFSGDLGRTGLPYLCDPTPLPAADLIICESTYGGKRHDTVDGMARKMSALAQQSDRARWKTFDSRL